MDNIIVDVVVEIIFVIDVAVVVFVKVGGLVVGNVLEVRVGCAVVYACIV